MNLTLLKAVLKQGQGLVDRRVILPLLVYAAPGVENRSMIFSKGLADCREGEVREFAGKKHSNLPRKSDIRRPFLAHHVGKTKIVVFRNRPLDALDGKKLFFFWIQGVV